MAGQTIYFIADPSGMPDSYLHPAKLEALLKLAELPPEVLDTVSNEIARETGFLSQERVEEIVTEWLGEETSVAAVTSIISYLRPRDIKQTLDELGRWRTANTGNGVRLTDELFFGIESRLRIILREYPALDRYRKAARLAGITGNRLDGADVLCDLRPVFDNDRECVEGFLPLVTLRLKYRAQDQLEQFYEVTLGNDMLNDVVKKLEAAQKKITTLRETVIARMPGGWVTLDGQ